MCRHIQQGTAEDLQLDGQRLLPQVPSLRSLHGGLLNTLLNITFIAHASELSMWIVFRLTISLFCVCFLHRSSVFVLLMHALIVEL